MIYCRIEPALLKAVWLIANVGLVTEMTINTKVFIFYVLLNEHEVKSMNIRLKEQVVEKRINLYSCGHTLNGKWKETTWK